MKTAILLHGTPSEKGYYNPDREAQSNEHWFPWLQHQLLIKDILAQTPEWPKPYEPNYKEWLKVFNQFLVDEDTILIGHSCGAGFLIRWLSENNVKVGKIILVAPWLDPEETIDKEFFNFKIDRNFSSKTKGVVVFYSDDDQSSVLETVKNLQESTNNVQYREFHNYGHFCYNDMKTREFPELLDEALK